MRTPGSYTIEAPVGVPGPIRSVSASSIVRDRNGTRLAEPPPIERSIAAFGPMTATLEIVVASSGSSARPSSSVLRRSTVPAIAARLVSALSAGSSTDSSGPSASRSSACTRPASTSTSRTSESTCDSATSPRSTAATRSSPYTRTGGGISMVSPAFAAPTVSCTPNQSDTTNPSKPHSSRRMPVSRSWFSAQWSPRRRLYALMIPQAPPSFTARSNGRR